MYTSVGLSLVVRVNTSILFSTDADLLLRSWTLWLLRWNHQGWRQNHCTGCAVWGLSAHVITNVFFLSFYFFMWKTSAVHDIQAAKLQKRSNLEARWVYTRIIKDYNKIIYNYSFFFTYITSIISKKIGLIHWLTHYSFPSDSLGPNWSECSETFSVKWKTDALFPDRYINQWVQWVTHIRTGNLKFLTP